MTGGKSTILNKVPSIKENGPAKCSNPRCHVGPAHSGPCDIRLFESEKALKTMARAATLAAERAERWENAYWALLDNGGQLP